MMEIAARQAMSLIAFTLPGTPFSARMARFYIRAALDYHDLDDYAEDIETVASELVSNAIAHAGARSFGLELLRLEDSGAIAVVVTDPCPRAPAMHHPAENAEHGRGLVIVEALSASWGWTRHDHGKAVFAIFPREGWPVEAISALPRLDHLDAD
jgi:anti-sigma regulatory factor (Ser/Thr protein kinase)